MELQTAAPTPRHTSAINRVFYNDRGLRAGWRLLMFVAILFIITAGLSAVIKMLGLGAGSKKQVPENLDYSVPLGQGALELALFLIFLLASWVMSRIERRSPGAYGLPLTRSLWPRFLTGYVFWGFLPLTVLLASMRMLHIFYFGSLALDARAALIWGLLWGFAFLMVGFFEEYSFRGYALYTLSDGIGFWPAAIILALVFAWVHIGNGGETKIGIAGVFVFAVFAAVTLWRTGSLWLAVGAHAGWDWGESYFYGVADSGYQVPGHLLNPHVADAPAWLTGGTVGPEGSILTLILWALLTLSFLALYKPRPEAPAISGSAGNRNAIVGSPNL
jgi:membrane protease YdiL (CAAX protease family)